VDNDGELHITFTVKVKPSLEKNYSGRCTYNSHKHTEPIILPKRQELSESFMVHTEPA